MIKYEPGSWGIFFAFQCAGSVFPKSTVIALPVAILTFVLHFGLRRYTSILDGELEYGGIASNVLGGFTSILGFLIVFRSQQAYSRWWEGGTLLQQIRGEWFNAYSSLLAFCNPAPERATEVIAFQHKLARLFSLQYSCGLEQVSTIEDANFNTLTLEGFELESLDALKGAHDRCEVVLQWIQREIVFMSAAKVILIEPPILSRVYNQLGNGIVMLNNARKITEFPIPFPLAQMVTFMLSCHWFLSLFFCVVYVPNVWNGTLICFIVVFSFWSINFISLELEMPFGDDPNDLPLEDMQKDFNASLKNLLQPKFLHPPIFTYNAEYHIHLDEAETSLDEHIESLLKIYHNAYLSQHLATVDDADLPAARSAAYDRKEHKTHKGKHKSMRISATASCKSNYSRSASCKTLPGDAYAGLSKVMPDSMSTSPQKPGGDHWTSEGADGGCAAGSAGLRSRVPSADVRLCPGGCGFEVTWHATHCCCHCSKSAGSHGARCDKSTPTHAGNAVQTDVDKLGNTSPTSRDQLHARTLEDDKGSPGRQSTHTDISGEHLSSMMISFG